MELDLKTRDALIGVLMNPSDATPSDDEIREAFGEGVDALTAKWRLRFKGYASKAIELAIQRATDRGVISFKSGTWILEVAT